MAAAISILLGSPAPASPWQSACEQFYELTGREPPTGSAAVDVAAFDEHYRRGEAIGFSGGAAVYEGGETRLSRGYGFADWADALPMGPHVIFDIGSLAKQFTAAAILRLEEQGRLTTDDTLARFFTGAPGDKRDITIHQLLTHTAGLRHSSPSALAATNRAEMVEAVLAAPVVSPDSGSFSYSNMGYALLAAIVEIASGEDFEAYLRRELWMPAGMDRTGWTLFDRSNSPRASGYAFLQTVPTPSPVNWAGGRPLWANRGAGAVLSTMSDLGRWARALRRGEILEESSLRKMIAPHVPMNTREPEFYGYGWALRAAADGSCMVTHDGSNNYHFNALAFYPERDLITHAVTVQPLSSLRHRVIGDGPGILLAGRRSELPRSRILSADEAARLAGRWRTEEGDQIDLIARGGRLMMVTSAPAVARLFTPFAPVPEAEERLLAPARARLPLIIGAMAGGNLQPLFGLLSAQATREEEARYWPRLWSEWTREYGGYRGVELIATGRRRNQPVTWMLLRFERGAVVAGAAYDGEGRLLIGNSSLVGSETELLPTEYVLAQGTDGIFRVHNSSLPGAVEVSFDERAERMTIRCPRGQTALVRIADGNRPEDSQ